MTSSTMRGVAAGLGLTGALAFSPGITSTSAEMALPIPCSNCATLVVNPGPSQYYEHRFQSAGTKHYCEDCHTDEMGFSCATAHTSAGCDSECEGECLPCPEWGCFEVLAGVSELQDSEAVQSFVERYSGNVLYNERRAALQIVNCEGQVIGHFPVSQELAARLIEVAANAR